MKHIIELRFSFIVYQVEFDKTRWYCSWNSDKKCTQNSGGGGMDGSTGGRSSGGLGEREGSRECGNV